MHGGMLMLSAVAGAAKMFDGDAAVDELMNQMKQDIVPGYVRAQLTNNFEFDKGFVDGVSQALIPIALSIAALFFFLDLLELAMSERANPETIVKFFAKLVIAIVLIYMCPDFINFGSGLQGDLNTYVEQSIKNLSNSKDIADKSSSKLTEFESEMKNLVKDLPWWKRLPLWNAINLFQIVMTVMSGVIMTVLITRHIELTVRGAFMPLAMAFVGAEGWQNGSIRYIKKYIAVWIQGPMISFIFGIANTVYLSALYAGLTANQNIGKVTISGTLDASGFSLMGFTLGIGTIMGIIGAIRGTMQIANDVMGV